MNEASKGSRLTSGLNYATTFEERLLGVKCDVEVVVELSSGDTSVVVAKSAFAVKGKLATVPQSLDSGELLLKRWWNRELEHPCDGKRMELV